jgi:hypothetical protein
MSVRRSRSLTALEALGLELHLFTEQVPFLAEPFRRILGQHRQARCRIGQATAQTSR